MAKDSFDRIQIRLNPQKNYLDALLSTALRSCPISRPALIRALLIKYFIESQGGMGISREDQTYIASVYPKAANRTMPERSTSGETQNDKNQDVPPKAKLAAEPAEEKPIAKTEPHFEENQNKGSLQEATPNVKPAHQWSATNLPPCMDMSDFDPKLMIQVGGKKL